MSAACEELVEAVVKEQTRAVAQESLSQAKKLKKKELEDLRLRFLKWRLLCYWDRYTMMHYFPVHSEMFFFFSLLRWQQALQVRRHVHQCAEAIPPLPPLTSVSQQLDRLLSATNRQYLRNSGWKSVGKELETSRLNVQKRKYIMIMIVATQPYVRSCYREEFFSAFDLPRMLWEHLLSSRTPEDPSLSPSIYWKLLLLYPQPSDISPQDQMILAWLCGKLGHSSAPPLSDLENPFTQLSISTSPLPPSSEDTATSVPSGYQDQQLKLAVSGVSAAVRHLDGEQRGQLLQGACSLVLFVPVLRGDVMRTSTPQVHFTHCALVMTEMVIGIRSLLRACLLQW